MKRIISSPSPICVPLELKKPIFSVKYGDYGIFKNLLEVEVVAMQGLEPRTLRI
jgi:hypothetical protein